MILAINILRVITAALMVSNLDSLFLFPLAFTILVLQKVMPSLKQQSFQPL